MVLWRAEMMCGFHVAHDEGNLHEERHNVNGVHGLPEGMDDEHDHDSHHDGQRQGSRKPLQNDAET